MINKATSPDGRDAIKINKSDGGAGVTPQRDSWFVCVLSKVQNKAGVQLGMPPILKVRGKCCMKLSEGSCSRYILNKMCVSCREHTEKDDPFVTCCLYNVLLSEPDFRSQKSWLAEAVEKYPGCQVIFYPKFHRELILLK